MKNTILSENDSRLLESALLHYGRIVTVDQLMTVFKKRYSEASAHNRIHFLAYAGWLKRIKRGLYLIIDSLTARASTDISHLIIANTLVHGSYVSLAYALNYYQLFDQYSNTIVSVTINNNKKFTLDDCIFKFSKVKKAFYFGYSEKMEGGRIVRIAEVEKALLDYLYLDKSFSCASLVFEKLRDFHKELNLEKLQRYAVKAGVTIQRKLGFMLDMLNLESSDIYKHVKGNRGFSKFTSDSTLFNAKWRLYYDDRIIR